MKAAIFDGKQISIQNIPVPVIKDSQALVRVRAVGICGIDLAIINGFLPTPIPIILGHEFSGEVVKIGKEIDPIWLNKRVTSEINSNIDFDCYYCKKELFTQCISRKAIGIDINGALAEYVALDSYLLHKIPSSLSYEEATFIEPLAAAYQTFETMPLNQNDKVIAIFGLGKLGLLITQVVISKGLKVIVIDGSTKKLNLAKNYGSNYQINRINCPNIIEEIKDITNGLGADIVVDATGNPNAINDVISSCKTLGKVHMKSTHGQNTPINLIDVVVREITIYSSRCGPFEKAIEGLMSGNINVGDLISKKFGLDDIKNAFDAYKEDNEHIKSIIQI